MANFTWQNLFNNRDKDKGVDDLDKAIDETAEDLSTTEDAGLTSADADADLTAAEDADADLSTDADAVESDSELAESGTDDAAWTMSDSAGDVSSLFADVESESGDELLGGSTLDDDESDEDEDEDDGYSDFGESDEDLASGLFGGADKASTQEPVDEVAATAVPASAWDGGDDDLSDFDEIVEEVEHSREPEEDSVQDFNDEDAAESEPELEDLSLIHI